MPSAWPSLPAYAEWSETCDTLHAHTQVLGKLAATLAPAEPQLQHAALRLTARGWAGRDRPHSPGGAVDGRARRRRRAPPLRHRAGGGVLRRGDARGVRAR